GIGHRETGRSVLFFDPAKPVRIVAGEAYAPDLLNFKNWEEIPESILLKILASHRELTRAPGSVFKGGAFDQCIGNWRAICAILSSEGEILKRALNAKDQDRIQSSFVRATAAGPEAWHPACGQAQFYPVWALASSIVAGIENDRAIRSEFDART